MLLNTSSAHASDRSNACLDRICSTNSTTSAVYLPSTATPKRRIWRIWACMPCSIAGRKARESRRATAVRSTASTRHGPCGGYFHSGSAGNCPGELAIGHTRYSTAGDTVLLNAQPFSVACNKGQIAVAHNGNITNAAELRRELEREGSIFQASSDTEVILHLVARSRERTLAGALREALLQMEGAFSLVFLARGPHHRGARSARIPPAGHGAAGIVEWSHLLRVRVGNLRIRPDRRRLHG